KAPLDLVLAAEHDRVRGIDGGFASEQVLREVERCIWEEPRAGHAPEVVGDARRWRVGDDAGERPRFAPEPFDVVDRPAPQLVVAREAAPRACGRGASEARDGGPLDSRSRRLP